MTVRSRSLAWAVALAALVALTAAALPAHAAVTARVVAQANGRGPYATEPVQARVGETVELALVLVDTRGQLLSDAPRLRWMGRERAPDGPLPAGTRAQWRSVSARMQHTHTPSPNEGTRTYSNAVLFGPRHGRWIGRASCRERV